MFWAVHKCCLAIQSASTLYTHLKKKQASANISAGLIYSDFFAQKIATPIQGLLVTCFPLWKLSYLLEKQHIEEDIVNGLLEMLYFCHAATCSLLCPFDNPAVPPSVILLPTKFYRDANAAYSDWPQIHSPQLLELQQRLCKTHIKAIGFLVVQNQHYIAFYFDISGTFQYGDLLGQPVDQKVIGKAVHHLLLCRPQLGKLLVWEGTGWSQWVQGRQWQWRMGQGGGQNRGRRVMMLI